jgi:peptide chain release factor 1
MMRIGRELAEIDPLVGMQTDRIRLRGEAEGLREVLEEALRDADADASDSDAREMSELAAAELEGVEAEVRTLEQEMVQRLIPKEDADGCAVVVEVRAGTGGSEASLFSAEIFEMYRRYAQRCGWQFEVLSQTPSDAGGIKEASAAVSGGVDAPNGLGPVYAQLKHENGVHRVQRVPVTESAGRVHTSAMTVIVLPQPEDVDFELNISDVKVETMRSQGAGGQHVNTTDSAVRLTHVPTGVVASCQNERSQARNKDTAFKVLKARLFDMQRAEAEQRAREARGEAVGAHSGERSERIRTYNFPTDRVTDHRIGMSKFGIGAVLTGDSLDEFVGALQVEERQKRLERMIQDARRENE